VSAALVRGGEGSDSMESRPVAVEVGGAWWRGWDCVESILDGVGGGVSSVSKEWCGASVVVTVVSSIRLFRANRPLRLFMVFLLVGCPF